MYRPRDHYYRRARAEGYRARSAFKLLELERRFHLFRPGDLVLDLGAWPGGWTQVSLERVGPRGGVVAVDKVALEALPAGNVWLLEADVAEPGVERRILDALGRPADVMLSDLAPKLSGVRARDEARCLDLATRALAIADSSLRPGGRAVVKTFGSVLAEARAMARPRFAALHATRPRATRTSSAEVYLVGLGFRRLRGRSSPCG